MKETIRRLPDAELEVMQAVVRARGWTWEELERVRADKAAERGGFAKKIFLTAVKEK